MSEEGISQAFSRTLLGEQGARRIEAAYRHQAQLNRLRLIRQAVAEVAFIVAIVMCLAALAWFLIVMAGRL